LRCASATFRTSIATSVQGDELARNARGACCRPQPDR
jgi:hypothetical protein